MRVCDLLFGSPFAANGRMLLHRAITWHASAGESKAAPVDEGEDLAKGQKRSSREVKKPKSDKPKGVGSTYKQMQSKGGQTRGIA
jgi:hypothetical protein